MKASALLLAATIAALMAVPTTAWPFLYPPHHHHHPFFPFPGHDSAPGPSSGHGGFPPLPPTADMTKCMQAMHDAGASACSPYNYDAGKCCTHLSGVGDSCTYIPYYKSPIFQVIVKHVCDGGSGSTPPPPTGS